MTVEKLLAIIKSKLGDLIVKTKTVENGESLMIVLKTGEVFIIRAEEIPF